MSRIHTGTGDRDRTGLLSGRRVSKADPRIAAGGDLDELNAVLGLLRVEMSIEEQAAVLLTVQSNLMAAGAEVSAAEDRSGAVTRDWQDAATRIEAVIDDLDATLPRLTQFIVPGGTRSSALAHVSRTVCRRAERSITALYEGSDPQPANLAALLIYLNRISDYLFVLARTCDHKEGIADTPWDCENF